MTVLLIAALIGMLMGWLLQAMSMRRLRRDLSDTQIQLSELKEFPDRLDNLQGKHFSLIAEKEADAADFQQALAAKDLELDQARMRAFESAALNRSRPPDPGMQQIWNTLFDPLQTADVAQRAFDFSQHRNSESGTPQEDWAKAEHQLLTERLQSVRQNLHDQGFC